MICILINIYYNMKKAWNNLAKSIQNIASSYYEIREIENDKLIKPIILSAYNCVTIHIFSGGITNVIYNIFYSASYQVTIISILGLIPLFISCFYGKIWIARKIKEGKTLISTNIYFGINIFIAFFIMLLFIRTKELKEIDISVGLTLCYYWIVHSFNLIPGRFSTKFILYIMGSIILFIMANPKISYGIVVLISTMVGQGGQLFVIWKKYHEDCKILNEIEYEKNLNQFLLSKFPEAVFILKRPYTEIVKMNEKAYKWLEERKIHKNNFIEYLKDLVDDLGKNLFEKLIWNMEIENKVFSFLNNHQKKQNEKIMANLSYFELEKSNLSFLVLRNISPLIEKEISILSQKYERIILYSTSHEIRSQLNLINGNLELIEKKFDLNLVKIAQYSGKILEHKLNLLQDFVKILSDKFFIHSNVFSLNKLREEVCEIINSWALPKKLQFSFVIKNNPLKLLNSDYIRIISMILHISLNAIKYTFEGFVRLEARNENNFLIVIISDSGIGINSLIIRKINEYSEKKDLDELTFYKDFITAFEANQFLSGLGLAASSMICNKLNGDLKISSKRKNGTDIYLKVQCKELDAIDEGSKDESCISDCDVSFSLKDKMDKQSFTNLKSRLCIKKVLPDNSNALSILIVDDQINNIQVLSNMLQSLGYKRIFEATNGLEGTKKVNEIYSLFYQITIFMDVDMPIMNGIEATKLIKMNDKEKKIKIVMVSAFDSEEIIESSINAGAVEYIVKPISFKKLKMLKEQGSILF